MTEKYVQFCATCLNEGYVMRNHQISISEVQTRVTTVVALIAIAPELIEETHLLVNYFV